jgi:hypothetical protein
MADKGIGVLWQGVCMPNTDYDLDGYAYSSQSDVTSMSSMVDYIKLDRFWSVNAKEWGWWQRPDPCHAHNMVEVKVPKILKQANRAVKHVILG